MKRFIKATGILTVLLSFVFVAQAYSLQVVKTNNTELSVGGLIQGLGEVNYGLSNYPTTFTDNSTSQSPFRMYLWNVADSLYVSGSYNGFAWRIETTYGGTANFTGSHTNGLLDLTDAYVNIPLMQNSLYLKVGQFKDPTNYSSATSSSAMLFTEKSPDFNLFFNAGYEMGLALVGHFGNIDGAFGVVQGAPNLPQRYLPELLKMPLPLFLRVGYSNGIVDQPFHQQQTGFEAPSQLAYAVHLNGFIAADSNAGHGTLFSQMGGALATFNFNQDYSGNVLLSSVYNPYLGLAGYLKPANSLYAQGDLDFQVRMPLSGGQTFALQGQGAYGYFSAVAGTGSATNGQAVTNGSTYKLNIYGANLIASLQNPTWSYAARFAVVVPDAGFVGTWKTGSYAAIFGNNKPIWEVTPSVSYNFNQFVKVTTEAMLMFNAPVANDKDGQYLIAEMPGTGTGTGYAQANSNLAFVPIGRMMLQVSF